MYDLDLCPGMKGKVWAVCYKSTGNYDKYTRTQAKKDGSEDSSSPSGGNNLISSLHFTKE